MAADLGDRVRLNTVVRTITRDADGVVVEFEGEASPPSTWSLLSRRRWLADCGMSGRCRRCVRVDPADAGRVGDQVLGRLRHAVLARGRPE
jgi:hypothetical protein